MTKFYRVWYFNRTSNKWALSTLNKTQLTYDKAAILVQIRCETEHLHEYAILPINCDPNASEYKVVFEYNNGICA